MKNVKFKLQISCAVGWDDNHDIATLEVHAFEDVLRISEVLKEVQKTRFRRNDEKQKPLVEMYDEIRNDLESVSGEEISHVGEVIGIQCLYTDKKGVRVQMSLNDNDGVDGYARIDNTQYENEYKNLLGKAKEIASEILSL